MRNKKTVKIGNVAIGGNHAVAVQSMTNTRTADIESTVAQIHQLEEAGCDIVRCTVPDAESADVFSKIKERVSVPLVADIHFDVQTAVRVIENGADKVRINPGNIGNEQNISRVVDAAAMHSVPIRVGANSGSVEKETLHRYGGATADALIDSALENIKALEKRGFSDIVVSLKSSDIRVCTEAYRKMNKLVDYPLHIGVTEAGTYENALIKSSAALGTLLLDGIGSTIRISITGDPVQEVYAAKKLLRYCGLAHEGAEVISCPTCGRCTIDIESIAKEVESACAGIQTPIKIAVMGCAVNGPGEAREADCGIAGGKNEGLLFSRGRIVKKVKGQDLLPELLKLIDVHISGGTV